jgi:hypothetical protein
MPMRDPVNRGQLRARDDSDGTLGWAIGAVATLFVLGLIVWGMSGPTNLARYNPPPHTTGQGRIP